MRSANTSSARAASPTSVPSSSFPSAVAAVDRVLTAAAPVVAQMIDTALPTAQALRALGDEVRKAVNQPNSVAHPELADPDIFWRRAAFPHASSLVRQLRGLLVEVADELEPVVDGSRIDFERWLRATASADTAGCGIDPWVSRERAIDAIAAKCDELHDVIAGVRRLVPETTRLPDLHTALAQGRRKRVAEMVTRTGETAEYADAVLRGEPPHRHLDLVLAAQELAHGALGGDIEAMIDRLTEPIFGLGERMVSVYGDLVAEDNHAPVGLSSHLGR